MDLTKHVAIFCHASFPGFNLWLESGENHNQTHMNEPPTVAQTRVQGIIKQLVRRYELQLC